MLRLTAAARLAKEDGVSLNQWIATAVAQKIGAIETAADFLERAFALDQGREQPDVEPWETAGEDLNHV